MNPLTAYRDERRARVIREVLKEKRAAALFGGEVV